jgi:hypothetical protein
MPIVIKLKKERACPVVVCDFCGEEIQDAKQGNAEWKFDEEKGSGATIFFTHKKCCHTFEQKNSGVHFGAEMLDHFLVFLANNVKLDWEKAREGAQRIASLG